MTKVRQPAVAGMFYPADREALHQAVTTYLEHESRTDQVPRAIIAPHAGYVYSGPVAGSAYSQLLPARDTITRVVIMGPAHRVAFQGIAATSQDAFETPLGRVPIDKEALSAIEDLPAVIQLDEAHAAEHSLEVHIPFLQEVLADFSILPLVIGDAEGRDVEAVIDRLWDGDRTLFVISSDLSHYHDYATAQQIDSVTTRAIEELRPQDISFEHACGRTPISGLLTYARKHGLRAQTVDLRNSGDTAGSRDQVVGYGAYVFT